MLQRLILLLLVFCASASSAVEQRAPLLWKIDGPQTHYLFGTIHLPDPRVTTLAAPVTEALKQSKLIVTELEFSAGNIMAMSTAGMLPVGESLTEKLPEDLRQALQLELKAIDPNYQLAMFDRMKVWTMATNLALLPVQKKYRGLAPLDMQLVQLAAKHGARNIGLEKLHEQLDIFDTLSLDEQLSLLRDAVELRKKARTTGPDFLELMITAYVEGNAQAILRLTEEGLSESPELSERLRKTLIDERNQNMADRIDVLIKTPKQKPMFIAVGAAHLIGESSVVDLLRKKGYTITRTGTEQEQYDERNAIAYR